MSQIQYPTSADFWGKEANIRDDPSTIAATFKNIGELATCAAQSSTCYRGLFYDQKNKWVLTANTNMQLTHPICFPKVNGSTTAYLYLPSKASYVHSQGSEAVDMSSYTTYRLGRADCSIATATVSNIATSTSNVSILGTTCTTRYGAFPYAFPSASGQQFPTNNTYRQSSWGWCYPMVNCTYTNTTYPGGNVELPLLCEFFFRNPSTYYNGVLRAPGVKAGNGVSSYEPINETPSSISAARMKYAILAAQSLAKGAMLMWADAAPYGPNLLYKSGGNAQYPTIWQLWTRPHWVPFVDGVPLHVVTLADDQYSVHWRVGGTIQTIQTSTTPNQNALQTLEAPDDISNSMVAGDLRYWLVQVVGIAGNVANPKIYSESAWLGGEA